VMQRFCCLLCASTTFPILRLPFLVLLDCIYHSPPAKTTFIHWNGVLTKIAYNGTLLYAENFGTATLMKSSTPIPIPPIIMFIIWRLKLLSF
jgi:hypothetical protein